MKILLFFVAFCIVQATNGSREKRETADEEMDEREKNLSTAFCIFTCLEIFQRKGIDGPPPTPEPLENGCDSLDFRDLVDICKAYRQADSCMSACIKSDSSKVIMDGLQHICVDRFEAFQKYTPCFNQQCPAIENACSGTCGSLEEAQDEWWSAMTDNNTAALERETTFEPPPPPPRRKRDATVTSLSTRSTLAPGQTTPESQEFQYTDGPVPEGIDVESVRGGFMETCTFLACYVNCSRPILVKECGEEAHELLKYTSEMLFSFLVAPFKPSLTNSNISQMLSDGCTGYNFVANLSTSALTSASSGYSGWQIWINAVAFFVITKMIKTIF